MIVRPASAERPATKPKTLPAFTRYIEAYRIRSDDAALDGRGRHGAERPYQHLRRRSMPNRDVGRKIAVLTVFGGSPYYVNKGLARPQPRWRWRND